MHHENQFANGNAGDEPLDAEGSRSPTWGAEPKRGYVLQLLSLHARVCEGKPGADNELGEILLPRLLEWLQARFPREDDQMVFDAVVEALGWYFKQPARFETSGGYRLDHFLQGIARRKLGHLQRADQCQRKAESAACNAQDGVAPAFAATRDLTDEQSAKLEKTRKFVGTLSAVKQALFHLTETGEKRLDPFARVLGIEHKPADQQKQLVQQALNRLRMQLRRGLASG